MEKITDVSDKYRNQLLYISAGIILGIILVNVFQVFYPYDLSKTTNTNYDELLIKYENLTSEYIELNDKMIKIEGRLNSTEKYLEEKISENTMTLSINDELTKELNTITDEKNQLEKTLESIYLNYTDCAEDSDNWKKYVEIKLFSSEIPHRSEVDFWLRTDATEELIDSPNYELNQLSILLSLKARERNWRVGVIEIHGNFSDTRNYLLINAVITREGLVYFDPLTDKTYSYNEFTEISPNKMLDIGKYKKIQIIKVKKVISY